MTESTDFGAPWDQRLTSITVATSAVMLGSTALLIWLALTRVPPSTARMVMLTSAVIPLVAFVLGFLLAPRGYAVGNGRLTIERPVCPIDIPLESIQGVEGLEGVRLTGAWRTLGSGGFFGYYGRFRSTALGAFRMYATRSEGRPMRATASAPPSWPDVARAFDFPVPRG